VIARSRRLEDKVLRRTRVLLQTGWCQVNYAENALGDAVGVLDPNACRWCISEALNRACAELKGITWEAVVEFVSQAIDGR
jgi:hypothetical protein